MEIEFHAKLDNDDTITVTTSQEECFAIVTTFKDFLAGCGFHHETIEEAIPNCHLRTKDRDHCI